MRLSCAFANAKTGQTIQEAYQLWNAGGTEIHNPNVDPRLGNVCLGVWKHGSHGTYRLAHRVWSYDANGNFLGTIHLSETITLGGGGNAQRFLHLGFLRPFRQLPARATRECHGGNASRWSDPRCCGRFRRAATAALPWGFRTSVPKAGYTPLVPCVFIRCVTFARVKVRHLA